MQSRVKSVLKRSPVLFFCIAFSLTAPNSMPQSPSDHGRTDQTGTTSWVDPDTGHRVWLLCAEPNAQTLYFNVNAFTADGRDMVYREGAGIGVMNLTSKRHRLLTNMFVDHVVVGTHSRRVFFTRPGNSTLYVVDIDSGSVSSLFQLPPFARIESINADESLIAGTYEVKTDGSSSPSVDLKKEAMLPKGIKMDHRAAEKIPTVLFTVEVSTGLTKAVLSTNDWIDHVSFSPKIPDLLLYAHEGRWELVDRVWTVRSDGTQNALVHERTMADEIAGHEFWDPDGKRVWYDLQLPKGQSFYLASYDVTTGKRAWYSVKRDAWSLHFNASPVQGVFGGDGADYSQVAKSRRAKWIQLFHQSAASDDADAGNGLPITMGNLTSEKLVNLAGNDYKVEPNVRFSPDGKLVIFTALMAGRYQIMAVAVEGEK